MIRLSDNAWIMQSDEVKAIFTRQRNFVSVLFVCAQQMQKLRHLRIELCPHLAATSEKSPHQAAVSELCPYLAATSDTRVMSTSYVPTEKNKNHTKRATYDLLTC